MNVLNNNVRPFYFIRKVCSDTTVGVIKQDLKTYIGGIQNYVIQVFFMQNRECFFRDLKYLYIIIYFILGCILF